MNIVGAVQARSGSNRLPNKVLADLAGRPMLMQIIGRVAAATHVDTVAVTTSEDASDDSLVSMCEAEGIPVSRGSVDDIIGRLLGVAGATRADVLVRVWGDCPFVAPDVLDRAIDLLRTTDADFVTNAVMGRRTYPPGLDLEVYRRPLLERMAEEVTDPDLRQYPFEFVVGSGARVELLQLQDDLSDLHLTVDYPEDLEAARAIYGLLAERGAGPDLASLLALIGERPELAQAFADAPRNPEYRRYLETRARE